MTTYELITTFLVPICSIVSWLAGARMRRNENLKALQTTIDMLVEKNRELYNEIVRLRQENDNLRDAAIRRDNEASKRDEEIRKLRVEIEQLKK